jgi:hypothetical protein
LFPLKKIIHYNYLPRAVGQRSQSYWAALPIKHFSPKKEKVKKYEVGMSEGYFFDKK